MSMKSESTVRCFLITNNHVLEEPDKSLFLAKFSLPHWSSTNGVYTFTVFMEFPVHSLSTKGTLKLARRGILDYEKAGGGAKYDLNAAGTT